MSILMRQFGTVALTLLMLLATETASAQPAAGGAPGLDLSYLPANAVLAVAARPQRVLRSPQMEMLPIEVLSAAGKKEFGVDPIDVQSVLAFVEPPTMGPPGYGIVARLDKPYQLAMLKLPPDVPLADAQLNGQTYRQSQHPLFPSIFMPDDRTLILAPDAVLKQMLASHEKPTPGPLSQLMTKTDISGDLVAVAVMAPVRPMLEAQLAQAPLPPAFADVKRVPQMIDAAKVEISVSDRQTASLVLISPTEAMAADLEKLINQLMDMGQQMALAEMASELRDKDDPVEQASLAYARRITQRLFEMFRPRRDGRKLRVQQEGVTGGQTATIGVLVALLLPAVQSAREAARRMQSSNNLKQIALAMHNYHDLQKTFPPRANLDAGGKPLLSWRVLILPYLGEQALYEQFHIDEPWDSDHNRKLITKMPQVYHNPSARLAPGRASYLVPTATGTVFGSNKGTRIRDIRDGTANTILVLEVNEDRAEVWTKPADLVLDAKNPLSGLGRAHPGGFLAAFADGSVHFLSSQIDRNVFLRLLTIADGQPVGNF